MTTTSEPPVGHAGNAPEQPGLRRDMSRLSLLFAGVGSIIGSGWLFGALEAAKVAGPASILSWAIAAVMILLIGLCFAELGTMFPVSGGVVRYPHLSFGSFASYTMGWITWVAAATVAPIEVEGALQYATKWAHFTTEHPSGAHTLTGVGYVVAVVAMAFFVALNYYGIRWFARVNNALVWWKLAIILTVVAAFLVTALHVGPGRATEVLLSRTGRTGSPGPYRRWSLQTCQRLATASRHNAFRNDCAPSSAEASPPSECARSVSEGRTSPARTRSNDSPGVRLRARPFQG